MNHHLPAYEDRTVCSETSAYKIQTPGNYPKEKIQHTENSESLKSRMFILAYQHLTNWKTEETLERAVVTLETERIKGSNP